MISDVVFARDPTVLDAQRAVESKYAFQHENYLDIKSLIMQRQLLKEHGDDTLAKNAIRLRKAT